MIDILLQPFVVVFSIILFLVLLVILLKYGDRLSKEQKMLIVVAIAICILYFLFLLWLIIGFGNSHPIGEPMPITE